MDQIVINIPDWFAIGMCGMWGISLLLEALKLILDIKIAKIRKHTST